MNTAQRGQGRPSDAEQPLAEAGPPELKQYLGVLRRRIWAVLTALVVIATLGTVHAFKATPVYRSEARLLIEKRSPRVMDFEDVVQLETSDRSYHKTQVELLRSRDVLEKALRMPGMPAIFQADGHAQAPPSLLAEARRTVSALLGTPPPSPPEPWEQLRSAVTVEQVRDTHLVGVSVEGSDPERTATIANAVARAFEQYHLEGKLAVSGEAFEFLNKQTREQEQKLAEAEEALQRFREQAQIVSLDASEPDNPALVRLRRLSEELTEVELERVKLEAELAVVQQAVRAADAGATPRNEELLSLPEVQADGAVGAVRIALVGAEKEARALADTYGPGHPRMQAAQAKVELLQAKLREALASVAGSLEPRLEMLRRREAELRSQHAAQNQLALAVAKQSLTYSHLQGEVQRHRKMIDVMVERMREVDLSTDYAKTNVKLVEAAEVPAMPVRPRKARTILVTLALGLMVGVGLAFFFEHMDDTVKTPDDLEQKVGVPVLGFVPAMSARAGDGQAFTLRGTVCATEPLSSASEAYRHIRTSLYFCAPVEESKAIVVTSGGQGDGKTTTATNLALVIAQSGKRVLLIDADLRRPTIHRIFQLRSHKGVSSVLVGEHELEEAVQRPVVDGEPVANLDVLAAGPKPPNPAELLDSPNMRRLLEAARQRYDRVVVDSPPVLFVADASILSGISDGVVMVVKSAKNTRALAVRAREHLQAVGARLLGGVLNDVRMARLGAYYSDYHYYGYSRYYSSGYGSEDSEQGKGTDAQAAQRA